MKTIINLSVYMPDNNLLFLVKELRILAFDKAFGSFKSCFCLSPEYIKMP